MVAIDGAEVTAMGQAVMRGGGSRLRSSRDELANALDLSCADITVRRHAECALEGADEMMPAERCHAREIVDGEARVMQVRLDEFPDSLEPPCVELAFTLRPR